MTHGYDNRFQKKNLTEAAAVRSHSEETPSPKREEDLAWFSSSRPPSILPNEAPGDHKLSLIVLPSIDAEGKEQFLPASEESEPEGPSTRDLEIMAQYDFTKDLEGSSHATDDRLQKLLEKAPGNEPTPRSSLSSSDDNVSFADAHWRALTDTSIQLELEKQFQDQERSKEPQAGVSDPVGCPSPTSGLTSA